MPSSRRTSTSRVGLPRESRIWRATMDSMLTLIGLPFDYRTKLNQNCKNEAMVETEEKCSRGGGAVKPGETPNLTNRTSRVFGLMSPLHLLRDRVRVRVLFRS